MTLSDFYRRQMAVWPMAVNNYHALFSVESRTVIPEGMEDAMIFTLQHNPERIRSTAARVDTKSVAARPCFLCRTNRPGEQIALSPAELSADLEGIGYEILLNPYPIFPYHFTIPSLCHEPQVIVADGCRKFGDMLRLAEAMPGMALFYNGAACGASAPDHFHFQAVPVQSMPILSTDRRVPFKTFGYETSDREEMMEWFVRAVAQTAALQGSGTNSDAEPRMNVVCAFADGVWKTLLIPRRAHRPDFYGDGDGQYLLSPASVDLCGTIVVPSSRDFRCITPSVVAQMLGQTVYLS